MPHDDTTKEKIRKGQQRYQARKRGELVIVEQPSMEEIQVEFAHTWADTRVRLSNLCEVADKMLEEIRESDRCNPRLIEVLDKLAASIAQEIGARQNKTQVELSGQVNSNQMQVHVWMPDITIEEANDSTAH